MNKEKRTAIILGIIIVGIVVGVSATLNVLDSQTTIQNEENSADTSSLEQTDLMGEIGTQIQKIDKSRFKKAPELTGIAGFINTAPEELKEKIKDSVVLYDIWTYSCINCVRTLPYITAWDEKYADQGLLIVGVHSPEFEFEKDVYNVEMAVSKHGINYPVVLDNDKEIWKAFENRYWPRKYIADDEGFIRYDHIGEGKYEETEKVIQDLLKERAQNLGIQFVSAEETVDIEEFQHSSFRTPELYFGYKFAFGRNQLGNDEGFKPEKIVEYTIPQDNLRLHYFYMEGTWKNFEGSMKLLSEKGSIVLPYKGKEVNIVASGDAQLQIFIDGEIINSEMKGKDVSENGILEVKGAELYNLVNSEKSEQHTIQIVASGNELEMFTFTFG